MSESLGRPRLERCISKEAYVTARKTLYLAHADPAERQDVRFNSQTPSRDELRVPVYRSLLRVVLINEIHAFRTPGT